MKTTVLIPGICGFAGSTLAGELARRGHAVQGFDNLIRAGSEAHHARLRVSRKRFLALNGMVLTQRHEGTKRSDHERFS